MTERLPPTDLMQRGAALHAAGQAERALGLFEQALAHDPASIQAASACATVLSELGRPQAAMRVLQPLRAQLMRDADGATNYAIAAENLGDAGTAWAAYSQALALDPQHARALNNRALLAAQSGDWPAAIDGMARCRDLQPDALPAWLNVVDMEIAAREFTQALGTLDAAVGRFGPGPPLQLRHAIVLAFDGQIEAAQAALDALSSEARSLLAERIAQADQAGERLIRKGLANPVDAYELFCQQAFDAMQVCDWRDHDRLTAVLRELLARAVRTGTGRDWRDAQLCALMLPLREDELAQLRRLSIDVIGRRLPVHAPYTLRRSPGRDSRIHVGLAIPSLRDARVANAVQRQLALHDHERFAIHVYSPTPQPDPAVTRRIAGACASAVEIAHMSDDALVERLRRDELDIYVDMAFNSPWCRPEIPERRVAPIQLRQCTWHRHHPSRPCDYNLSDRFVHPDSLDLAEYGAVVRLAHTCWLALNDDAPEAAPPGRTQLGLPAHGLVLCTMIPALMIDPHSFGLWMQMLSALPGSVWWLPAYPPTACHNLRGAAARHGIDPARLVFQPRASRARTLAMLPLADLFVDTVRFNANQGLVDALRMGVPAISCAGQSMASRLGGSIIESAGLPEGVTDRTAAFVDTVVQLGRDRSALAALRDRLGQQRSSAPLFDAPARLSEWEWAWQHMVQRQRDGAPPTAFDVPGRATGRASVTR